MYIPIKTIKNVKLLLIFGIGILLALFIAAALYIQQFGADPSLLGSNGLSATQMLDPAKPTVKLLVTQSSLDASASTKSLAASVVTTDDISVTRVEYLLDGKVVVTTGAKTPNAKIDISSLKVGTEHTLQAVDYDGDGNIGKSTKFKFTVSSQNFVMPSDKSSRQLVMNSINTTGGTTITPPSASPNSSPSHSPSSSPSASPSASSSASPPPITCNKTATTSTFAATVSAATAGQTVCLADGDYGTFTGTNKAITIRSASGQGAIMALNFASGDAGFTLASVTIAYQQPGNANNVINQGAHDITIRDSRFISQLRINVQNANILLDHNTHNNIDAGNGIARVKINAVNGNHTIPSGVTVRNSFFSGGDSDGLNTDTGVTFYNNEFLDICVNGPNHTDNIQVGAGGAEGVVIQHNYIHQTAPTCNVQAIGIFDGLRHATITDNVVFTMRQFGLELYSDDTSVVAHNTFVSYTASGSTSCMFNLPCGQMFITAKTTMPAYGFPNGADPGFGTIVKDNILRKFSVSNATFTHDHNMLMGTAQTGDFIGTPKFIGGTFPTSWAGYCLAPDSPGKGQASDGKDVGIRCN